MKIVLGIVAGVGSNSNLPADRKILVASRAAHYRWPQSFGDSESHSIEGLRQRSLSSRWAISPVIIYRLPPVYLEKIFRCVL